MTLTIDYCVWCRGLCVRNLLYRDCHFFHVFASPFSDAPRKPEQSVPPPIHCGQCLPSPLCSRDPEDLVRCVFPLYPTTINPASGITFVILALRHRSLELSKFSTLPRPFSTRFFSLVSRCQHEFFLCCARIRLVPLLLLSIYPSFSVILAFNPTNAFSTNGIPHALIATCSSNLVTGVSKFEFMGKAGQMAVRDQRRVWRLTLFCRSRASFLNFERFDLLYFAPYSCFVFLLLLFLSQPIQNPGVL